MGRSRKGEADAMEQRAPGQDTPATPANGLLTAEEVSSWLRLPLSTVYHLAKTGALPAIQLGRSWRFSREALDQLVARAKTVDPRRRG